MQTPFNTILNLLIESPSNIIYHLALAFAVVSSLQAALISRRSRKDPSSNRLILGLGMLLLGQALLYLSSGLAWQNILEERVLLPPLDRAIMLFSLVWIIWLWVFPTKAKLGDLVTGLLNLGIVIFFLFSYTSWGLQSSTQHFNSTWIDQAWVIAELVLVGIGLTILIFLRPSGWEYGLGMLSLILAGTTAHLILAPADKDFPSYMRLGQLAAFPLLPTLLNRLGSTAPATPKTAADNLTGEKSAPFPRKQERRRHSADPRTIHAWLALLNYSDPEQILSGVAKALAHTMISDICFIVSGAAYGQIILQTGYDLIREEKIPGTSLGVNQLPSLAAALQRGKPLLITSTDAQPPDLNALNAALGLQGMSSLLLIPLFANEKPDGAILFLSPYSDRQWSLDDQGYLASEMETITRLIHKAQQPQNTEPLHTADRASESQRGELEQLRQDNKILLVELSEYRKNEQNAAPAVPDLDLNALVALQQEAQDQINSLLAENERLLALSSSSNRPASDELNRMEQELRRSLQDTAMLQNQLAEANARNMMLERDLRQTNNGSPENLEVITSIVQEIRQPLASINGYTDLLLSESVGILVTLQHKFLERIQASTERLRAMLDDLIRVTMLRESPVELLPQPVELAAIIDGAVADASGQLREKNIALRVDLPEDLPQIFADRDAIQQIILHLLQNAGAATPLENTITLRARVQKDQEGDFLLIQVTDTGCGVRAEDLPRVFARNFRAEKPLIEGLGDSGVGLSIARTLVEAHGGRIWVDSVVGQSTTFSILLPMHLNLTGAMEK